METVWTDMMTLLERGGEVVGKEEEEREREVHRQKERRGWRHVLIIIPLVALTNLDSSSPHNYFSVSCSGAPSWTSLTLDWTN